MPRQAECLSLCSESLSVTERHHHPTGESSRLNLEGYATRGYALRSRKQVLPNRAITKRPMKTGYFNMQLQHMAGSLHSLDEKSKIKTNGLSSDFGCRGLPCNSNSFGFTCTVARTTVGGRKESIPLQKCCELLKKSKSKIINVGKKVLGRPRQATAVD